MVAWTLVIPVILMRVMISAYILLDLAGIIIMDVVVVMKVV